MDRKTTSEGCRDIRVTERPTVPWLGVVFGYAPMLPFVGGAGAAWWLRGDAGEVILRLTILWGCAILLFLAGVRRGLSFRTQSGETLAQILTMLGLFGLGISALVAAVYGLSVAALVLLIMGYAAIVVLDPIAAKRGEAPLFFARLRPAQIPLAIGGLAALLALKLS